MAQDHDKAFYYVTVTTTGDEAVAAPACSVHDGCRYFNRPDARLYFGGACVGSLCGKLLLGGIADSDGIRVLDLADAISDPFFEVAEAMFSPSTNDWQDVCWELLEPSGIDLLYLHQLEIAPDYRGRGLGLLLMQAVLRRCPHSVAFLEPFPLRFAEATTTGSALTTVVSRAASKDARSSKVERLARARSKATLNAYYGRLGFVPIALAPYLVRSNTVAHRYIQPTQVLENRKQ